MSFQLSFKVLETAQATPPPTNDAVEPKPGDTMPDGAVFAGISPDTNQPTYTTPADASLRMKFYDAQEYAAMLEVHGHKDSRVPTKNELNALFNNLAAIVAFNINGSNPASWYWSSSQSANWRAWGQRFGDGTQGLNDKNGPSSMRPVR
jgi:hypothetical protein